MSDKIKICIFGASSERIESTYNDAAYQLGKLIAEHDWEGITGAGRKGLMKAVSDGILDNGGFVTGIIPKFMVDNGWNYDRLSSTIVTADMHQRKEQMAEMADAFVALPGGCGTIEELMEIYTWRQLNLIAKPLILLNTIGFYEPLIKMITRCGNLGFMKHSHERLWDIAKSPKEVITFLEKEFDQGIKPAESKY